VAAGSFFLVGLGGFAPFFLLFVFAVAVFLVINIMVTLSRVRATQIEERGVWLAGVAEEFVGTNSAR
jgi:hypothetical protein